MNRIFKIIKNIYGQYIVVSEFAKQAGKSKSLKLILPLSLVSLTASASLVTDQIPYEDFRNFAENKGRFHIGATNIPVYDKQGQKVGTVLPDGIPMPDFSPGHTRTPLASKNERLGILTLVHPQYVSTVQHQRVARNDEIYFANHAYSYRVINPNNTEKKEPNHSHAWILEHDFSTPRLSKMVTEIVPVETIADNEWELVTNDNAVTARTGSGQQWTWNTSENRVELLSNAYRYLTGGTSSNFDVLYGNNNFRKGYNFILKAEKNKFFTHIEPGDSGSPLYVFDKDKGIWKFAGGASLSVFTNQADNLNLIGYEQGYAIFKRKLFEERLSANNGIQLDLIEGQKVIWTREYENNGGDSVLKYNNADHTFNIANHSGWHVFGADYGKNLYVDGGSKNALAEIDITNDIDQGAGGIFIGTKKTSHIRLHSSNGASWLGSGIWIGKGSEVEWQLKQGAKRDYENNVIFYKSPNEKIEFTGDRLSKLGKGTMKVIGERTENYINNGLSIGDGQVILNTTGQKPFAYIELASGRGLLTFDESNDKNLHSKKIDERYGDLSQYVYFGYRGGKLDLNGQTLSLNLSKSLNNDEGLNIVNHHSNQLARLELKAEKGEKHIINGLFGTRGYSALSELDDNIVEDVKLTDKKRQEKENFELVQQLLNKKTETERNAFITSNTSKDKKIHLLPHNGIPMWWGVEANNYWLEIYSKQFENRHNGQLDISYKGNNADKNNRNSTNNSNTDSILLLSGGLNLNGNFTVEKGKVIFSGQQVNFADEYEKMSSVAKPVIKENEWITRDFVMKKLELKQDAKAEIGRNVGIFSAEQIITNGNNDIKLGFKNSDSTVCYSGETFWKNECQVKEWDKTTYDSMPQSLIYVKEGIQSKGSNNNIRVGKAILYSGMNRENSSNNNLVNLTLSKDAIWQLPRATKANETHYLGDLTLEAGSKVLLNPENEFHTFNQLNIQKLSGNGYFRFNTDLASLIGNKVIIQEAQGEHMISVQDSGKEPSSINEQSFEFFKVSGNNTASFKLENGHIDAGAFRYKMSDLLSPRIKLAELKRIDKSFEEKQQAKRIRALTEEDKHAAESFIIETPLFKVKGLSHVIGKSFKKEISKYTNTAMSEFSAALHNLAEVNSSIHQHLVQENLTGKSFNVWSAVKTLNADYHSMYHRDYRKTGSQQQFGVDFSANHNLSFGTMLTHSQENNRFADVSSSRGRLTMFSAYAKHQLMDSLSIAMDLGMGQLSNQIVQDE
ncbi:MAG: S6 family peptidase, partial [Pasteurella oralis]|uniref:S6 family peptidase n=1 Tax=Pasteurella oralis TaxID=1071947 RepID=UPI0026F9E67D|nr:S6 family peptidase [Pasteurella oralis]